MFEDLISEILLCLPVKSLLRFSSVSKPWLYLISSPCLIISYLRYAITKPGGADDTLIVYETDYNSMFLLDFNSREVELPSGFPYSRAYLLFRARL